MAEKFNLDPELGTRVSENLSKILNGDITNSISTAYIAMTKQGENNLTEQFKKKFINIQNFYNDSVIPAMTAVQTNLDEYTDLANYMNKIEIDISIKAEAIDPIENAGFAEAMNI